MPFHEGYIINIITFIILMMISGTGNSIMLVMTIKRKRKSKSWLNILLMHLAIAGLLVTFLMMPLEIGWSITVFWQAGDAMCRIMSFFRVFGLYLSIFLIVYISINRYLATMRPRQRSNVDGKGKIILICMWVGATLCSFPQVVVFHLEKNSDSTSFMQCTTINIFPSYVHELLYFLFAMTAMFWFPLCVLFYIYIRLFAEIRRRSSEGRVYGSPISPFNKTQMRNLKMTLTIIVAFIICWTPYYAMSVWHWVDWTSSKFDKRVQKALLLVASINSCINPIIYCIFNIQQKNKTNLTSSIPLMPINATVERSVIADNRGSTFTVFLIAMSRFFNFLTSHNKRVVTMPERAATIQTRITPLSTSTDDEDDDDERDNDKHGDNEHNDDERDNDKRGDVDQVE